MSLKQKKLKPAKPSSGHKLKRRKSNRENKERIGKSEEKKR